MEMIAAEEGGTVKNSQLMVQSVVAAAERVIVPYQ
jgi:hypothetical protein